MAIVSPWAENGNLTTYLEHEGKNLSVVRRFQIVSLHFVFTCQRGTDGDVSSWRLRLDFNIVCINSIPLTFTYDSSLVVHTNNVIHGDLTGVSLTLLDGFNYSDELTLAECTRSW
jgi:hypothetical protein